MYNLSAISIATFIFITSLISNAPLIYVQETPSVPVSDLTAEDYIRLYSDEYKLSEARLNQVLATVKCESNFRSIPSRIIQRGELEQSFGIAQIHLPSHPNITKEQALDIDFSAEFIVKAFKNGEEWKWTCWKTLYTDFKLVLK